MSQPHNFGNQFKHLEPSASYIYLYFSCNQPLDFFEKRNIAKDDDRTMPFTCLLAKKTSSSVWIPLLHEIEWQRTERIQSHSSDAKNRFILVLKLHTLGWLSQAAHKQASKAFNSLQ
jgi:hypothetical protein